MKFIINSEALLSQLSLLTHTTSTTSVVDCFEVKEELSTSTTVDKSIPQLELPSIAPYSEPAPTRLVGFNEARCESRHYGTVHFYIDDKLFNCTWRDKHKYIPLLQQYDSVIGPDFSQYVDMTYDERYYNAWRNRTLTAYWQSCGIKVIPNVTWSLPDSYDYSFTGIPKHSIVAVNCTAIRNNRLSCYLWRKGYEEMLRRLEPRLIIRYGDRMPSEKEKISKYFPNERLQRLRCLPRTTLKNKLKPSNQLNLFNYGR